MKYEEVLENARTCIGPYCKACYECNSIACKNIIPGTGSIGVGDSAIRNYDKWKEIRLNMDTITEQRDLDTSLDIFGRKFSFPVFIGPMGGATVHYGYKYNDKTYTSILVEGCKAAGIAPFTGDGIPNDVMRVNCKVIKEAGGLGVPTIKPWNNKKVFEKFELVKDSKAFAVAMDIDGVGIPMLQRVDPPAICKSIEELRELISKSEVPFIIKGIMTAKGAIKAREAGAEAIIVSNHGGRVMAQGLSTAEVLEEITAVSGDMKVLVDGGIRSGADIFKALALGADGVLICRPFVVSVYGGGVEGVKLYADKLRGELEDAMQMCGAYSLDEITRDMVRK